MTTPIAGIEVITASNNVKFTQHNNGLIALEAYSIGPVIDLDILDPTPLTPAEGDLYIIKGVGAGAWTGLDNDIVQWLSPSWTVYSPFDGLRMFVPSRNQWWQFDGTNWGLVTNLTTQTITLPHTLLTSDRNQELIVASGTGNFNIPDTADNTTGFEDYWECLITLDGVGDITIQRAAGGVTNLITESGNQQLKTQGRTVKLRHRGSNVWKVDGALEP